MSNLANVRQSLLFIRPSIYGALTEVTVPPKGKKFIFDPSFINELSSSSSESSSEVDEEGEVNPMIDDEEEHREGWDTYYPWISVNRNKLSPEYFHISRLLRFIRLGDTNATVVGLSTLLRFDLESPMLQMAINDSNGYHLLLNILETNSQRCQIVALKILNRICDSYVIKRDLVNADAIKPLVKLLGSPNVEMRSLSAELLGKVCKYPKSHHEIKKYGGIPLLIDLIDVPIRKYKMLRDKITEVQKKKLEAVTNGAKALATLCYSTKMKLELHRCGGLLILESLLKSNHHEILPPVIAILVQCASMPRFRNYIRSLGLVDYFIKYIDDKNLELTLICCKAISKCSVDPVVREQVGTNNGLEPLVRILKNPANHSNRKLMAAVCNAIWKVCETPQNVHLLQKIKGIEALISILRTKNDFVLIDVIGALKCCATFKQYCTVMREGGVVEFLITLLTFETKPQLIININNTIGELVKEPQCMKLVEECDGVRYLWSQLKSTNPQIQSAAAYALCPCIKFAKNQGYLIRSFVGGLELVVRLLQHTNRSVLTSICALICRIVGDKENLAVITDYGIVRLLARIAGTSCPLLQEQVAETVAACCTWGDNCANFGKEAIIPHIANYFRTGNEAVRKASVKAAYELSKERGNIPALFECGLVPYLIKMAGNKDREIQDKAFKALNNIRMMALDVDVALLARRLKLTKSLFPSEHTRLESLEHECK